MKIILEDRETSMSDSLRQLLQEKGYQVELEQHTDTITIGNTTLVLSAGSLENGHASIRLSSTEFAILHLLFQNPRQHLTKELILSHVWGYDSNAVDNHVEVYMSLIRRKLKSIHSNLQIVCIRKFGYHLEIHP